MRKIDPDGRKPPHFSVLSTAALAVVIAAALVYAVPFAWTTIVANMPPERKALADCATTLPDAARLACYDVLGKEALLPPAKGANAPWVSR